MRWDSVDVGRPGAAVWDLSRAWVLAEEDQMVGKQHRRKEGVLI